MKNKPWSRISGHRLGLLLALCLLVPVSIGSARAQTISAGYRHSCRVEAGGVQCWGDNTQSQIGVGQYDADALFALDVDGIGPGTGATAVSAGKDHTCAIQQGALKCWGTGFHGQLGFGDQELWSKVPKAVPGMSEGVTAVSAGAHHTCAVKAGALWCWGANTSGELGTGDSGTFATPQPVSGMSDGVLAVAVGRDHTCAVKAFAAWCWGKDSHGALGNGAGGDTAVPSPVNSLGSNVTAVFAGSEHSCAIQAGALKCWGRGDSGQLGNNAALDAVNPSNVSVLVDSVTSVAAGTTHTCAARQGTVYCWGQGAHGQIGNDGSLTTKYITPQIVAAGLGPAVVAAGDFSSCYQPIGSGQVHCWGAIQDGLLGDGSELFWPQPMSVDIGIDVPMQVSAGVEHTCVAVDAGNSHELKCWGNNDSGQLGNGTAIHTAIPASVGAPGTALGATSAPEVASGWDHTCALLDEAVKCWGSNTSGQLGTGSSSDSAIPTDVQGLGAAAIAVATGYHHSCAIQTLSFGGGEFQALRCWGKNNAGQVGNTPSGAPQDAFSPTTVINSGVQQVALGGNHSCAVKNAALWCWGENKNGELGMGDTTDRTVPVMVPGLGSGVTDVASGGFHTCAIHGGQLKCWGQNGQGQLGIGSHSDDVLTPAAVVGLSAGVVDVVAGGVHSCARKSDGSLWCWGRGAEGQLGNGLLAQADTPSQVIGLGPVLAVSAGQAHTCAISNESGIDTLWCWGNRLWGRLGDGELGIRLSPGDPVITSGPVLAGVVFSDGFEGAALQ